MALIRVLKLDPTTSFPVQHDPAADSLQVESLVIDAGGSGINMNASKITNLDPGTPSTDAVNLSQLNSVSAGFDPKESVRVKTSGSDDLSGWTKAGSGATATLTAPSDSTAFNTIDGVALSLADRVLVTTAGSAAEIADVDNRVFTVTALGDGGGTSMELTIASDFDTDLEVTASAYCFVAEGTAHADTAWFIVTNDSILVDTTPILWSQFAGVGSFTGGDGIDITLGAISVDLATDPALEFDGGSPNKLRAKVNPAGAIERVAAGLGVILEATDPSLQIAANELGVKFDPAGALEKTAAGTGVRVDGVSVTIVGNELTAPAGDPFDRYTMTAGTGGVSKGDPVYPSANDAVLPCDNAASLNPTKYCGCAVTAEAAASPVQIQQEGVISGVSIAGGPAAGDLVWLDTPSGLTVTLPTGSGTHRLLIGKVKNTTGPDLIIEPQYMAKL